MTYLLTDGFSGTNLKPLERNEISASDSGKCRGMQWTNSCPGRWDVVSVEFSNKTLPEWSFWQDVVLVLSATGEVSEVWSNRSGKLEFCITGVVLGRTTSWPKPLCFISRQALLNPMSHNLRLVNMAGRRSSGSQRDHHQPWEQQSPARRHGRRSSGSYRDRQPPQQHHNR